MGLLQQLCKTYDLMMPAVDFTRIDVTPMAPVAHTVKFADVSVTIDVNGGFVGARRRIKFDVKDKDGNVTVYADPKIVMPVTEQSLGRSTASDKYPHYLSDFLRYMLPENEVAYGAYVDQLSAWVASQWSDPKVEAVLTYVRGGKIFEDLSGADVLPLGPNGALSTDKIMICWDVVGLGDKSGPCWEDRELMDRLTAYHLDIVARTHASGLCMVTGEVCPLADQHPKGVVPFFGNAKLVSFKSSDNNKFTYKGRFIDWPEAVSIGYESSQKAHNALAWLVANQGVYFGNRTFISWSPAGVKMPSIAGYFGRTNRSQRPATPSDYKKQLHDSMVAWRSDVPDGTDVVMAVLDAATPGCLSIVYYNEMDGIEYLKRFKEWEETCFCNNFSPSLGQLVQYAYGTPADGKYMVKDELYRSHVQRLVMCRLDGSAFPFDIYANLVEHASNLILCDTKGTKGASPREKLLVAACSAIRKYRYDMNKKEELSMSLDRTCIDRDYLYGRLLAVAEHAERRTYDKDEKREPAAMRFQHGFVQQPAATWQVIYDLLGPYFAKLRPGTREFLRKEIGEVMDMFPVSCDADARNARLNDLYLLGYYHERAWLRNWKSDAGGSDGMESDECHEEV